MAAWMVYWSPGGRAEILLPTLSEAEDYVAAHGPLLAYTHERDWRDRFAHLCQKTHAELIAEGAKTAATCWLCQRVNGDCGRYNVTICPDCVPEMERRIAAFAASGESAYRVDPEDRCPVCGGSTDGQERRFTRCETCRGMGDHERERELLDNAKGKR